MRNADGYSLFYCSLQLFGIMLFCRSSNLFLDLINLFFARITCFRLALSLAALKELTCNPTLSFADLLLLALQSITRIHKKTLAQFPIN